MATRLAVSGVTIGSIAPSFRRSLEASNKSPRTVVGYFEAVNLFSRFLADRGMPLTVDGIRREHVEAFVVDLLAHWKPATANTRFRSLQQLFKWLIEEGEIKASPMVHMKPPVIPESPPPVLTEDQLKALFRVCEGNDFEARRDMAIIRLFADTGMRRSELANLRMESLDLDLHVAVVEGKGRRTRACAFGKKTALAL
ncbi:MAG: tyrosine-type recombinase/integrase, partial [Chloroflexota bacterium]